MRMLPHAGASSGRGPRAVALTGALAGALAAATTARPARAAEFEVQGDTSVQAYEVHNPWGDVVLERRRFTQTIGLGVYNLQGRYTPGEADYRVVVMMRLSSDFGLNQHLPGSQAAGETTYATASGNGVRFIPGLQPAPLDMMYGYIEGRNLAHGLLGFKLGRQYLTDVLGWWSFDGALVKVTTPFFVSVEAYGGLEQRGGLPLSTSRYERQGVWRGSHTGFGVGTDLPSVVDYPSYLYAEPAPAFGFAVDTSGPTFLHSRLAYRRVYNTGTALTAQFPDPIGGGYRTADGTRISQERIGWAADAAKADLGTVKGGFSYDLYSQIVATYYGGLEGHLGKHVTVGADLDYFVPTFDGDSIWNWFTRSPVTTATGRTTLRFTKRFDMSVSGGARLWTADGDPSPTTGGLSVFGAGECQKARQTNPKIDCTRGAVSVDPSVKPITDYSRSESARQLTVTPDALANLAGRYRFGSGEVALRGMLEMGARGSREGADVSGERRFDGGRFTAGTRLSVYGWADPTRPDRDAVSFSYVLAAGFKPASVANFRVEWEHDMNRLIGQRFRVVGLVNLLVLK